MKISKNGYYALRALIYLALRYNTGMTQMQDIARKEGIPKKFLEQIMLLLKGAGYLRSRAGVGGGYELLKSPKDIRLGEIIRLIDGPLAPVGCVSKAFHIACPKERTCGLRSIMLDVRNVTAQILDHITLADICERTIGHAKRKKKTLTYYV
ncbi:MAG: Rrf2 family transcriptional regulator [Candidatus Omnitrophica bacterium]|nr:Rrf2 family transcriptional regulator [Candidatus Omnitrophota bacterium]